MRKKLSRRAWITVNKNSIPFDKLPPAKASGIRLGTPAVTTRYMGPDEMRLVASFIAEVLTNYRDERVIARIRAQVRELCNQIPIVLEKRKWKKLMNETESWTTRWFPRRRFDADFPLVLWFAGLWFYLKSFFVPLLCIHVRPGTSAPASRFDGRGCVFCSNDDPFSTSGEGHVE